MMGSGVRTGGDGTTMRHENLYEITISKPIADTAEGKG
jgi:hypothetical protein